MASTTVVTPPVFSDLVSKAMNNLKSIEAYSNSSDEDLKKIGVAAELGYAMPPHVGNFPDIKQNNEFLFPDLVLASVRFGHGALLQWRHDPATIMNMLTQVSLIAADRTIGNATQAAKVAAAYYSQCRSRRPQTFF